MTTTTIRIPDEEYNAIQELAKFHGVNVSTFMRETIIERVQDEADYKEAIAILNENNDSVSREDVIREVLND